MTVDVERARRLLSLFKAAIIRHSPFLFFSTTTLGIRVVDDDHKAGITVSGKYINIYRNALVDETEFGPMLVRALLHGILAHPIRAKVLRKRYQNILNIDALVRFAAEVVVSRLYPERLKKVVQFNEDFLENVIGEDWRQLSMEEIVRRLVEKAQKVRITIPVIADVLELDEEGKEEGGKEVVLQKPDKKLESISGKDYQKLIEELEKKLKENLLKSYHLGAGKNEPTEIRKLIEELLKGETLPWHVILRRYLDGWWRQRLVQNWRTTSRKSDMLPGVEPERQSRVIVAVDVSGSIEDKEYSEFVREVLRISRLAPTFLVIWDVRAELVGQIKTETDFKLKSKSVRGYGGTQITSLRPLLKKMRIGSGDLLIVLTDGAWYEGEEEVQRFLGELRCKKLLVLTRGGLRHAGFDAILEVGGGKD